MTANQNHVRLYRRHIILPSWMRRKKGRAKNLLAWQSHFVRQPGRLAQVSKSYHCLAARIPKEVAIRSGHFSRILLQKSRNFQAFRLVTCNCHGLLTPRGSGVRNPQCPISLTRPNVAESRSCIVGFALFRLPSAANFLFFLDIVPKIGVKKWHIFSRPAQNSEIHNASRANSLRSSAFVPIIELRAKMPKFDRLADRPSQSWMCIELVTKRGTVTSQ